MSPFVPTDPDDATPFDDPSDPPRTRPLPFVWPMADGVTVQFDGEDIAMWVHCGCGMSPLSFVRWLLGELETLDAIDRYCSK